MAGSNSYERGGQPRTVPDADAAAYEAMVRKQGAYNAKQEAREDARRRAKLIPPTLSGLPVRGPSPERSRRFDHPGALESMIPVWGSGKEALADLEDRNYLGAAVNAGLAVSDLVLAKAVVGGLAKGAAKTVGSHSWRQTRRWMGDRGYLKAGEPGHHWAIRRADKSVPDVIKNQPWNIKGGLDDVTHGRIDHRYGDLPPFNEVQRIWYGTPDWFKAVNISAPGHAGTAAGRAVYDKDEPPTRR